MSDEIEMEVEYGRSKKITIGGIPMLVYMRPNGEYRWSKRQASLAVGYNERWLKDTLDADTNALAKLRGYGFKGDKIALENSGSIEPPHLISTEDFMAMMLYAALVGGRKPAIALMGAAIQETLERRADHVFGVFRDEDEYIQKFEYRLASIMLNKDLRSAIKDWIDNNSEESLKAYTKKHSIKGGVRGIYATALGEIYRLLFGRYKPEINKHLDVPTYKTPKDHVHVNQLQRIAQIEDLAAKYILRKKLNPLEAIREAVNALMIEPEEPRLGDRITRQDVHRVLGAKKTLESKESKKTQKI
jgi:hypothetical protein